MNKGLKILIFVAAFGLMLLSREPAKAQCAVCSANVASNVKDGGKAADGLNHGIMYLLGAPYLAVGILGYVWYKKYRRKNVDLNMREEKLHLN
jgi:UPF0716 family protein affecting phage T7 exclusion